MVARPALFTVEFRRKMAELSPSERRAWLNSLAARMRRTGPAAAAALSQELREVARGCRLTLVDAVAQQLGPLADKHLSALLEVPRERFVRAQDIERSADDTPLPLDDEGFATISAPHAYLLSYRLLELSPGDGFVELGTGSGYGAALAAFVVGAEGRVTTFEIDPDLAAWAKTTLAGEPNAEVIHGDAMSSQCARSWEGKKKIAGTFAVESLPATWLDALPEGGKLVAPVGARDGDQRLVLATRCSGRIVESEHGAVRYVKNRSSR